MYFCGMKKFASRHIGILFIAMFFNTMHCTAQQGINAEQLRWRMVNTGVEPAVWVTTPSESEHSYEGNIAIPSMVELGGREYRVTGIDTGAFAGCAYLASVVLPPTIEKVGSRAFAGCPRLVSVLFTGSMSVIESEVFMNCMQLQRVLLPWGIVTLGESAFYNCQRLQYINLPSSTQRIEQGCFAYCINLLEVRGLKGVSFCDSTAFEGCSQMTGIKNKIHKEANQDTDAPAQPINMDAIYQPRVTTSDYADINAYDFVASHDGQTFYFAVEGSMQVAIVSVLPRSNNMESSIDMGYKGHLSIPSHVTHGGVRYEVVTLGERCFANNRGLTSVTIPNGVTTIGDNAFLRCTNLQRIELPETLQQISATAFDGCSAISYRLYSNVLYLGNDNNPYIVAVKAATSDITECDIHPKTILVADGAFANCRRLVSAKTPLSIRYVGAGAFQNCVQLTKVVITEPNTIIRPSAFNGCDKLTKMTVGGIKVPIGDYEW